MTVTLESSRLRLYGIIKMAPGDYVVREYFNNSRRYIVPLFKGTLVKDSPQGRTTVYVGDEADNCKTELFGQHWQQYSKGDGEYLNIDYYLGNATSCYRYSSNYSNSNDGTHFQLDITVGLK